MSNVANLNNQEIDNNYLNDVDEIEKYIKRVEEVLSNSSEYINFYLENFRKKYDERIKHIMLSKKSNYYYGTNSPVEITQIYDDVINFMKMNQSYVRKLLKHKHRVH